MAVTPNMGLVKWSNLEDPYDHTQLAGNFQSIDAHDHTTGKGVQIPTAGIANEAITTAKIAAGAVTGAKIAAGAVSTEKLAVGVTSTLGDVKFWWRPNGSTAIPTGGWVVAEGQSLLSTQHEFPGGGTIVLPNLIEKFVRGSLATGIGSAGGAATVNLAHSHGVNSHTHGVAGHAHGINLNSGFGAATNLKVAQDLSGSSWVHSDNVVNAEHRHSISGSVEPTSLTTEGATATTGSSLGSTSILPPYVGLLPLVKVKN